MPLHRTGSIDRAARCADLASALALVLALGMPGLADSTSEEPSEANSCVECHDDPDFRVKSPKLYAYFSEWNDSIHRREGVTCDSCHGGNPAASDKSEAHGEGVAEHDEDSGVYYKNIADMCGRCHADVLVGFRRSRHFASVAGEGEQGPNCVTCHGSIEPTILDVSSVEEACAGCHNKWTGNHPENPERARVLLNRFLSIQRFYRYIGIRAEPEEASAFFQMLDPRLQRLSTTWHTFDLQTVDVETAEVLDLLKAKRDELRTRRAEDR